MFLKIEQYDDNNVPALICTICLKDLSKAIHFRNKAIKAEKYFKRSDECSSISQFVEPEVHIKLEDDLDFEKIKSEPIDEDPKYEFVDENPTTSSSFTDVFIKPSTEFYDYSERGERKKKKSKSDRYGLEDFCCSSGIVKCKLCMKSFTSVNSYQNHMKTVHREMSESEMHKCKYCNRFFKLKIYLNRHVTRIHKKQESLNTSKNRNKSKKRSTGTIFDKEDVSLYCEICKQFFTTRGSLQKHM